MCAWVKKGYDLGGKVLPLFRERHEMSGRTNKLRNGLAKNGVFVEG